MLRTLAILLLLTSPAVAQKVEPIIGTAPPVADDLAPADSPGLEFFPAGDVTMNAAIAEAQRTLPLFLSHVLGPDGVSREGSIKVSFQTFPTDQGDEIIWVTDFRRLPDGSFTGRLNNQPFHLGDWQRGDIVSFPASAIQDWSLPAPGGLFGNYTTRVIAAQPGNGHIFNSLAARVLPPEWE
ncbi:hypothetical protein A8B78_19755 [Jannaschia sp. EhC01]|nr:hypothetical protein A8B78_19755 [Jannaschia sp. EhC01]